jgi:LmbE family N-acetylglucosaminyl deacetylase
MEMGCNRQQHYRRNAALLIAAHPDDLALGAWGWVERHRGPLTVAYLTDGAPLDPRWRAPGFSSRAAYREQRRSEAKAAWRSHPSAALHFAPIPDQQLSLNLPLAEQWLQTLAASRPPAIILSPAWEGGHPDHDSANLLAARIAARFGSEVLEYALYTARGGIIVRQCFPEATDILEYLSPALTAAKRAALGAHASQWQTLLPFDPGRETIRPLPRHDYCRRPCPSPCVYEIWGWPCTADQIAARFAAFLAHGS